MKGRQPTMNIAAALKTVQNNMNASLIGYIGLSPQQIEREYTDMTDETIRKLFVGDKITKQRDRQRRYQVQKDKVKKRRLPTLKVGDLVYIAYGRKLKKYYPGPELTTKMSIAKNSPAGWRRRRFFFTLRDGV